MNEDTLILYYYNDGLSDRERRRVEAAIHDDPEVAARYDTLCRELNGLSDESVAAVPAHTVERWHTALDAAARRSGTAARARPRVFSPSSFAWGAALAAALVIGINLLPATVDPVGVEPPAVEARAMSPAIARGVQAHFRTSYAELAALPMDSTGDRTALVRGIIEQNRLYERAAEKSGADDLARVLRAFEPILVRLAAEDTAPEDAEALRAKLVFELNVMLTKLSRDSSNRTEPVNTGIET